MNNFCDKEECLYNAMGICISPDEWNGEAITEIEEQEVFEINSILDFSLLDDYLDDEALEIHNEINRLNS